jgi:hypothetical protein
MTVSDPQLEIRGRTSDPQGQGAEIVESGKSSGGNRPPANLLAGRQWQRVQSSSQAIQASPGFVEVHPKAELQRGTLY